MSPAAAIDPVQIGDVLLGKYRVTRLIGRGGMGIVVEAVHAGLDERVAIKVLHERYRDDPEALARFEYEARAAARIRGAHSCRLIDVGATQDQCPFIVMEYLEGNDLAGLLRAGPLPIDHACLLIVQACEGMAEVHAAGIIHRDLKPGNLFVAQAPDGSPLVKVLDFGIAKSIEASDSIQQSLTMTLVAMGTPAYMSPEQVRSSRDVDPRADVWSLGAILYELLAGRAAFGGNSVTNITAQVLEGQPEPLTEIRPQITPALDRVVRKALSKPPDGRYPDMAALALALAPFAGPTGPGHAERSARILEGAGRITLGEVTPGPVADDEAITGFNSRRPKAKEPWLKYALIGLSALAATIAILVVQNIKTNRPSVGMAIAVKGVQARTAYMSGVVKAEARDRFGGPDAGPEKTKSSSINIDALPSGGRPPSGGRGTPIEGQLNTGSASDGKPAPPSAPEDDPMFSNRK